MKFLEQFKKDLSKADIPVGASEPPRYWYSTGNYVLNRLLSGSFSRGVPQGRVTCFTGPSGAGKSFIVSNVMREAQAKGAHIVVLDSENALDDDFVSKIGVDTQNNYTYVAVTTIPDVQTVISKFIKGFKTEYGNDAEAPEVLFVIDSLDMLMTETEEDNFDKGITKGDQGQRNKQLKAMLRSFVQAIKGFNITMVVTAQVYKNQDVMNGEGVWIVSDAIKYSLSQIAMLTKLKLRETGSREVEGIRMKVEGYKTRFTKPFQTATIEVPYDTGMDPYNGLLEAAVGLGVVEKKGSRYQVDGDDNTWYSKDFDQHAERVLQLCEEKEEGFLSADVKPEDIEHPDDKRSVKQRRQALHSSE